jgi:hypothetical protein
VPPANYVTMLSTSGVTSATVSAATSAVVSAVTVYEDNGVQQAVTGTDALTITSSNPSVVLLGASMTSASASLSTSTVASTGYTIPIWGVEPGTATITISDSSNPSVAPITVTVTVSATALPSANISSAISTSPTMTSVAYFDLNGMTETAYSATTINEIGSANSGTVVINTPMLETAVATPTGAISSTVTAGDTLAVWQSNGSYYYIDLSQELISGNVTSGTLGLTISSSVSTSAVVSVFTPSTFSTPITGTGSATLYITLANNSGTVADQSWQLASPGQSTYVITGATTNSNYLNVTLY